MINILGVNSNIYGERVKLRKLNVHKLIIVNMLTLGVYL